VAVEIARALGARLGLKVVLVENPKPAQVLECLQDGRCDLAYMGIDPARSAVVDFTLPFMQQDFTFLVPAGSAIHSVSDTDRPGVRIAVVRGHVATFALNRMSKQAEKIVFDVPSAAFEAVRSGAADTWASARYGLLQAAAKLPGSRVLEDRYGANLIAMAVAKGRTGRLSYLSEFVEEAKTSGFVQRAIESAKLRGYQVVPASNSK
jgi:polar amino acid transport system substrate-binding protein